MVVTNADPGVPPEFARALESLRAVRLRPEIVLSETPAPGRIAPFSVAVTADVVAPDASAGNELATGRLVVLHDPDGQDSWDGRTRLVAFVKADLEPEMAADPPLAGVGWSWITDALEREGADHRAPGGTVTSVASESFGSMTDRGVRAELEIRASWTAVGDDLGPHLRAWAEVLCVAAGLPPLPPGVASLPKRRHGC